MLPQIVGNSSGTLFGVAKEQSKERLARDSRDKSGLFLPPPGCQFVPCVLSATNACVLFGPTPTQWLQ